MSAEQIIFLLAALAILGTALMVVTTRNLVHAALWLVAVLFGVAVLFVLLQAAFLAVVQVVVYIGAIAVLFIFAVMLTRREMRDTGQQTRAYWWIPAVIGVVVFLALGALILSHGAFADLPAALPEGEDPVRALGTALVDPNAFVLPFEISSILLLAALVGAVYIAGNPQKKGESK